MTNKIIATASLEISELAVFKCARCACTIRPKEGWLASFLSETQVCERCGSSNKTEALLRDFLNREQWPAIAQIVMAFTAVGRRIRLKNRGLNEIDLALLSDPSAEAVEVYFRNHGEYIYLRAPTRLTSLTYFPEKLSVFVNMPDDLDYVDVDVQILYHRNATEQDLATRWYRIFSSFAHKAESSFMYQAQSLVEGQIKQYVTRHSLQISGTFSQIIEDLIPRLRTNDALRNCLSTFRTYSRIRNRYTHEVGADTRSRPMDRLLARLIQFSNIMEVDKNERIIVKKKLKTNTRSKPKTVFGQRIGGNRGEQNKL